MDEFGEEYIKNELSPEEIVQIDVESEYKKIRMSHLSYIYIFEYRNLKNIGLSFDPRFEVTVDTNAHRLSIKRKNDVPTSFWGDSVTSLTAIVGNNGTGKSTVLRFVLEALVKGSGGRKYLRGIVITSNEEEHLKIYLPEDLCKTYNYECDGVQVEGIERMERLQSIETFYYGAHFNPLATPDDILTQRWSGLVNASDGYLLARDLQDYGNEQATNGYFPFRDYATAYNSQNQYRICYFLNQYESEIKNDLKLPRYVMVFPNKAGEWAITHRIMVKNKIELPQYNIPREWEVKEQVLAQIAYHDMVNLMADGLGTHGQWSPLISEWTQFSLKNYNGSILDVYGKYVQTIEDEDCQKLCGNIYECIGLLENFCGAKGNTFSSWLYFDLQTDKKAIETLLEWIVYHRVYLTGRFFDMYYTHNFDSLTTLSSGEQELLNLYSRIYDSIVRQHQRGFSDEIPQLFIFDEAEIGMHPEWQRKFVNYITTFLNDICNITKQKCQIVLTSHSPIILSDIPVQCCNMLKHGEDGETINVNYNRNQTFGSNIFELYKDSFFLAGGLVGEFASAYIQQLDKDIEDVTPENKELLRNKVLLVGDRVVRDYLMGKLLAQDKDGLKDYYRKMLQDLENEQD